MQYGAQQAPQQVAFAVEEKYFQIDIEHAEHLVKQAVEDAANMKLTELAPGMWQGETRVDQWTKLQITARAMPTDEGTSIELRAEHKSTGIAVGLFILAIIFASMLIVPLFWMIPKLSKRQQDHQQARLITMHRMWRGIADAIGAPKRASYRQAPKRVLVPHNSAVPDPDAEALAEAEAEHEAAAAAAAANPPLRERH